MTMIPVTAFEQGVLTDRHLRLTQDIDRYAERAGIDPHYIWTAARTTLVPAELTYLVKIGQHNRDGMIGLCYTGPVDVTEHQGDLCPDGS